MPAYGAGIIEISMKIVIKILKILGFCLLLFLAGLGAPLGAIPTNIFNRLKAQDDGEKTEMVEKKQGQKTKLG